MPRRVPRVSLSAAQTSKQQEDKEGSTGKQALAVIDRVLWQAAWTWVRRQHARGGLDDHAARDELARWLAAHPQHRKAYDEASRLWLLVGLVPPANDVPPPDEGEGADRNAGRNAGS